MSESRCPKCNTLLGGLARYCFVCRGYMDNLAGDGAPEAKADPTDTRSEDERADPLTVTLPWFALASDNLRKTRGPVHAKEYTAARDAAHLLAMQQVGHRPWFTSAPVRVGVTFWLPDRRRRDPNNLTKMLCDALTSVAWKDDSQIRALSWEVAGIDPEAARAVIEVKAMQTEKAA